MSTKRFLASKRVLNAVLAPGSWRLRTKASVWAMRNADHQQQQYQAALVTGANPRRPLYQAALTTGADLLAGHNVSTTRSQMDAAKVDTSTTKFQENPFIASMREDPADGGLQMNLNVDLVHPASSIQSFSGLPSLSRAPQSTFMGGRKEPIGQAGMILRTSLTSAAVLDTVVTPTPRAVLQQESKSARGDAAEQVDPSSETNAQDTAKEFQEKEKNLGVLAVPLAAATAWTTLSALQ